MEILLRAAVGTASHQNELEAYTVCSRCGNMGFMMSTEHATMTAVLEAFMKEEQLSVIRFFVSDGIRPNEIHRHLKLW
jgi:hypothetical protein